MNADARQRISAELARPEHAYPADATGHTFEFVADDEAGDAVECPECEGFGHPAAGVLCPRCGGAGVVKVTACVSPDDGARPFADEDAPQYEATMIVTAPASASLDARATAVRELADQYAAVSEACGAVGRDGDRDQRLAAHVRVAEARQRLHDAIDELAAITPADRARAEGR